FGRGYGIHKADLSADLISGVDLDLAQSSFFGGDSPVLSIATLDSSKLEGTSSGTTPFTFKISRTGSTSGTNTVQWQVAFPDSNPNDATGSDFLGGSFPNGLVTFNPGDTTSK